MSTTDTALTAHLEMPDLPDSDDLLMQVNRDLDSRFGISHSTLQIEHTRQGICGDH